MASIFTSCLLDVWWGIEGAVEVSHVVAARNSRDSFFLLPRQDPFQLLVPQRNPKATTVPFPSRAEYSQKKKNYLRAKSEFSDGETFFSNLCFSKFPF